MTRLIAKAAASILLGCTIGIPAANAAFGDPDCSFGNVGSLTLSGSFGPVFGITPEPAGTILLRAGFFSTGSQLYRIDASGGNPTLIASTSNIAVVDPTDALQGDGRILSITGRGNGSDTPPGVARYLPGGGLDTAFGTNGYATMAGLTAVVAGPLLQADGRIVVAGTFNGNAALVRFNANGSVDTTYGSGGAVANPAAGPGYASIALETDGSVVALAYGVPPRLWHYLANGTLDASFGSGGSADLSATVVAPTLVRVQPSGKIVVQGTNGTFNQMRVARYTATGAADTSIGSGTGFRDVRFGSGPLVINQASPVVPMTLMPDGRPMFSGFGSGTSAMVRWTVDFADETALTFNFGPSIASGLPDGRTLVANHDGLREVHAYLGVANPTTCITTNTVVSSSPNPSLSGQSVTITAVVTQASGTTTPPGSVLFKAGTADLGAPVTLANGSAAITTSQLLEGVNTLTATYTPSGSGFIGSISAPYSHTVNARPGTTITISSSPNPSTVGQSIALTAVVTGSVSGTPSGTIQFVADGLPIGPGVAMSGGSAVLNTPVLRAGTHTLSANYSGDSAFAPSSSASISQVVNAGATPGVFGDRDCNFGNNGAALLFSGYSSTMNAVADNGTLVIRAGQDTYNSLQRVGWLGNLINGLGSFTLGAGLNDASDVVLPDGTIVYAIGAVSTSSYTPGVGRLLANGAADGTFGNNGIVTLTAFASSGLSAGPLVQSDGRMLVAGRNAGGAMLMRLNADGTTDTSFGSGGVVSDTAEGSYISLALQPDGRILALGSTMIVRYLANGQIDTSFGNGGRTLISAFLVGRIVRLQPSGHIVVEGSVPGASPAPLRIARFTPNGLLDTSAAGGTGYRNVTFGGTPVTPPLLSPQYFRPLTLMPDGRPMIVMALPAAASFASPTTGVLIRYGLDLSDDAAVSLDFPATFVTVLPDGKFLLGRYGTAELRRLLDVADPPSCIPTTTTMTSSPNPSDFAQPVTLTATVSSSSGTPTGSVQFRNGATFVGSSAALNNGVATLVTSSLPSGTLSLSAVYTGAGNFAASASPVVTQVVHTALTIDDPTVNLATAASMTFTVTLTAAMTSTVTVDYATADHTALAGVDYTATSGTLTFAPGETTKTVVVALTPRTAPQVDKDFFLLLSNPTNSTLSKTGGIGTIVYVGSGALSLFIDDPVVLEGYSGITLMGFTVSLSQPQFSTIVTVNYATANGTATAGVDFTGVSGTVRFGHGETKHFVMVPILANATQQADRTLFVNLSAASGATIVKAQGTGTIKDDDPTPPAATISQYRLYSPITKEHLYTTDTNEYSVLGTRGWVQEGVAYTMFKDGGSYNAQYPIPLYRMYHGGIQQHHWTTDTNEVMVLVGGGAWSYEGIAGYVLPSADAGSTPLYRLSYRVPALHLWTTDLNEKDTLVAVYGWRYEGVVGEVLP